MRQQKFVLANCVGLLQLFFTVARLAQLVEHYLDTVGVTSSSLVPRTIHRRQVTRRRLCVLSAQQLAKVSQPVDRIFCDCGG